MGSFWKNNPSSPTWFGTIESWAKSYPSKLIDLHSPIRKISLPPGFTLREATSEDIEQLPEFWTRFFSASTRCIVPLLHIRNMVSKGIWTVLVIVREGNVIGSLVRRWIKGLHMEQVTWQKAGVIDYFCIHPAYRNKGIGRTLLSCIQNITERPIPPHLMLLEGFQLSIPPVSADLYWSIQTVGHTGQTSQTSQIQEIAEGAEHRQSVWKLCVKGCLWSDYQGHETKIWKTASGYVAILNTFHYSIPGGLRIGQIIGYTGEGFHDAARTVEHGYGILLMSGLTGLTGMTGWKIDSPYQFIGYNIQSKFLGGFPGLCF
jgi:N-acetylglutamate synthase-like GNAT family acetyltransferase